MTGLEVWALLILIAVLVLALGYVLACWLTWLPVRDVTDDEAEEFARAMQERQ